MAAVAMLTGCMKEEAQTSSEKTSKISVEIAETATKTYVEGEKIYWHETGEQLNIIYFADESTTRRQSATHEDYSLVDNKATFTADISKTDGAEKYTFGAFYPYAYKSTTSSISLTVPQEQTPTATSYDPKADILVSAQPVVTEGIPDKVQFQFSRMVALVNMTVTGITPGESIEKITVISSAKPAGSVTFMVHEAKTVENAVWYNNYEDITLNMGGRVATGSDEVWFTTVPTVLSGTDLTVKVSTDKNDYIKSVDLTGKTLRFERANIARFTVTDLAIAEKPKTYKLLTDASELTPGDVMVISTKGSATSSAYLLGTQASGTKITVSSQTTIVDGPEIIEIPDDARIFTVEAGAENGTLSFKATDGYLYGNFNSSEWTNTLWVKDTKDAEASWTVSVNDENNKAYIYNAVETSRCVNCSSTSSSATFNFASPSSYFYVYIYYIDGTSDEPEQPGTPEVTPLATPAVTATASGNTVTATWNAVDGAKDYTVTCDGKSQTVTATSATFAELEYETEYTVSVVANPADETANTASDAGTATATTEADPNAGAEPQTVTVTFPVEGATLNLGSYFFENDKIGISASGTGWRTATSEGYNGLYMGSGKKLKITSINKTAIITKVTINAVAGKSLALSYEAYNDHPYSKTTGTYSSLWEGNIDNYITFTTTSASFLASITVEYK